MGIDIYARYDGQTAKDRDVVDTHWSSPLAGALGYLREAYHGEPYVTRYLVPEAFNKGGAVIAASTLQERLPMALGLAEYRERVLYGVTNAVDIERVLQSYRDFVAFCEQKEQETGTPAWIEALW